MAESGERGYEDIRMPFGQHKDKLLADIPNSYLDWLLDQEWMETKHPNLFRLAGLEKHYRTEFDIEIDED